MTGEGVILMDIAGYRAALREVLGAAGDVGVWSDDLLDAGLRQALAAYQDAAAPVETSLVVETSGCEQSIGKLVELGLARLAGLAWPWTDDATGFEIRAQRWTLVGPTTVRLLDVMPAVGDVIRARYWAVQTVAGLDDAVATTVLAAGERAVAYGAAGWAAHVRCRQLSEAEAAPAAALPGLWQWQAAVRDDYRRWLDGVAAAAQAGRGASICWPALGL
jgi:hypothetical protein